MVIETVISRLQDRYAASGPPAEPATDEDLAEAEDKLGFALPVELERLFKEFANGGFGPAFGIFGVGRHGHVSVEGWDLVDQYLHHRTPRIDNVVSPNDPAYTLVVEGWPDRLLPLTAVAGTLSLTCWTQSPEKFCQGRGMTLNLE